MMQSVRPVATVVLGGILSLGLISLAPVAAGASTVPGVSARTLNLSTQALPAMSATSRSRGVTNSAV